VKNALFPALLLFLLAACSGNTTSTTQTATNSAAIKAPDENAALDAVRKVSEAQATHFKVNRRYALSFDELVEAHLLGREPSAAETGYEFKLRPAADAQTYRLSAAPAGNAASARSFFVDQTGAIRAEAGKEANADSPEVK